MTQDNRHSIFFSFIADRSFRSVLCLNAALPDKSFFDALSLPILACDGAANTLHANKITPDVVLGDLDSILPELRSSMRAIHLPDQNYSDFEKAIHYAQEHALLPTIVLGINGGFIDHIQHNIAIFARMPPGSLFYDAAIVGQMLEEKKSYSLTLPIHTKLSLLPMPTATLSTSGLKWDLTHETLQFPYSSSCFNRVNAPETLFTLHSGALLFCLYLQPIDDAGSSLL